MKQVPFKPYYVIVSDTRAYLGDIFFQSILSFFSEDIHLSQSKGESWLSGDPLIDESLNLNNMQMDRVRVGPYISICGCLE